MTNDQTAPKRICSAVAKPKRLLNEGFQVDSRAERWVRVLMLPQMIHIGKAKIEMHRMPTVQWPW